MAYDVASSIGELLFENNSVIIPNFGGFMLSYKSASIDHVQSTLSPPSKYPSFNDNLKVNDGILVNYVKNQNQMTLEQAKKAVADHVEQLNDLFENKEMVDIPKVGRLYKDYTGEIKFLPHDTNFNTNTFGLPQIQFHPIQRNAVPQEAPAVATATATTDTNLESPASTTQATIAEPVPESPNHDMESEGSIASMAVPENAGRFGWARKIMPFLIAASLLVMAVSFYFLQKDPHPEDMESAEIVTVNDNDRLNTKPTLTSDEISEDADAEQYVGPTSGDDNSENNDSNNNDDDNSSTSYSSGNNECIIIVGQFGVRTNARRFRKQVESDGYDTFSGKNSEKGWSMVGVKFNYDSNSEKQDMLRKLQREYDDAAWIYKD